MFVYFNLHKLCWSMRDRGLVVARENTVYLHHVAPKVSEAGRLRVIRGQRKNVHAGLTGTTCAPICVPGDARAISYNPYKAGCFYYRDTGEEYAGSEYALMESIDGKPSVLVW